MSSYPYCDTPECKDKEYGLITSNVLELDFGKIIQYQVSGTKVISLKNTDTINNAIIYSIVCLGNPEYSCTFWDLDISLVDFEAGKFLKIHCNDGIISDTDNGLVIKQAHTTTVVGDESLVDIDITIEIDTENSLIRLLLPKEVKSYSGGAVFKYTVVTQGDINFYWGN